MKTESFKGITNSRAVFLDFDTVDLDNDLDRTPLTSILPQLEFFSDTSHSQLHDRLVNTEIVLTNSVAFDRQTILQHPKLKLIGLTATGFNHIDVDTARQQGVAVTNLKDYCTQSVIQHAFSGFLSLNQKLFTYHRSVKAGHWNQRALGAIRELPNLTLGIVGHGVLGSAMAELARAVGMTVLIAGHSRKPLKNGELPLSEVLARSDGVSIHVPLNIENRGLIGARELGLMKKTAILVNVSRGGVVDSRALAEALLSGRLGGAFIDVFDQEPPPPDHPLLQLDLPNLILSPHMAWGSFEARQRAVNELAANISAYYKNERRLRVV